MFVHFMWVGSDFWLCILDTYKAPLFNEAFLCAYVTQ